MSFRAWLPVLAAAALVAGCTSNKILYDMGLDDVDRPAAAKKKYGVAKITKAAAGKATTYVFEDNMIRSTWVPSTDEIGFTIENKTTSSIKIIWDEAAYQDPSGNSHRVIHNGVKLIDKNNPMPPSIIVRKGMYSDFILPTDAVSWNGKSWSREKLFYDPLFPVNTKLTEDTVAAYKGKTFQVMLPLGIDDVKHDYVFSFKFHDARLFDPTQQPAPAAAP